MTQRAVESTIVNKNTKPKTSQIKFQVEGLGLFIHLIISWFNLI